MAARLIFGLPQDAHSDPLLQELNLEDLDVRRRRRIVDIVTKSLSDDCHPAFRNMFQPMTDGTLVLGAKSKKSVGDRRFSVMGAKLYNEYMVINPAGVSQ